MSYLCVVLGIVLILLSIRTLFRNFIFNFYASENILVNIVMIFLILASIFCTLASFYNTTKFVQMTSALNTNEFLDAAQKTYLEENIPLSKIGMITYILYGYASITISLVILKIIQNKKNKSTSNSNSKWNINKFQ